MDNWLALFDGQTRYTLAINDSPVQPDVLKFTGHELRSKVTDRVIFNTARIEHQMTTGSEQ